MTRKHFDAKALYVVQVSELYPKEKDGDDDLGDLWLVKYDDGDSEHMDLGEVG